MTIEYRVFVDGYGMVGSTTVMSECHDIAMKFIMSSATPQGSLYTWRAFRSSDQYEAAGGSMGK